MQKLTGLTMMLLFLGHGVQAQSDEAPWEGDPMVVTGEATDGGNILCVGSGCAGILNALIQESLFQQLMLRNLAGLLDSDAEPDLRVDRGEFCERLEDSRPDGCSRSSAPSVPGFDPHWQANGCGVGGWRDSALSLLASMSLPDFSGDLDAPFPGVSFRAACETHDFCYGVQLRKSFCDGFFQDEMNQACDASTTNDARTICYSMSSAYHTAVVQHGDAAYDSNGDRLACAVWHAEMAVNGCSG